MLAGLAPGVAPEVPGPVVGGLLERVAGERGWQVVAKEVLPDHVRVFVRVGPTDAPAAVVRAFEGRTARVVRQELWSPLSLVGAVGYVWEWAVRRHIEHRWDAVAS